MSSLDHDGRVAYLPAAALLRADPSAAEQIAVRLSPSADPARVSAALTALGVEPKVTSGATARGVPLVNTLRAILRAVAIVDGLVCLYALVQSCALTLAERRRTVAVLRATGAGAGAIRRLLAGVVAGLVLPAAVIGIAIERLVLGPVVAKLAANYATLATRRRARGGRGSPRRPARGRSARGALGDATGDTGDRRRGAGGRVRRAITRRRALGELLAGTALLAAGCGSGGSPSAAADGSTLRSTYADRRGTGELQVAPGEPLRARTELLGARDARTYTRHAGHAGLRHRCARPRRAVAGAGHLPGSPRAAVSVHVSSPRNLDRAGARRCPGRRAGAASAGRYPGRRPDRQRPGQRARARARGACAAGASARAAAAPATSGFNRLAMPIRSTTAPTSTRRCIAACCKRPPRRLPAPAPVGPGFRSSVTTTSSSRARSRRPHRPGRSPSVTRPCGISRRT